MQNSFLKWSHSCCHYIAWIVKIIRHLSKDLSLGNVYALATPHLRSGAEAGRTPCPKGGGQDELPHVRGQGQQLRVPGCYGAGTAEKSYPSPRSGVAAERRYPANEVRGGGREELPHATTPKARGGSRKDQPQVQGAEAAWAQEGLEELSHVKGQERWQWGDTPRPR